jgi:hypothetical protein
MIRGATIEKENARLFFSQTPCVSKPGSGSNSSVDPDQGRPKWHQTLNRRKCIKSCLKSWIFSLGLEVGSGI